MSSNSIYQWHSRHYYILRNKTSEKLYMGQTAQSLDKYLGSGLYWTNHCKAHGGYNRTNIELIWSKFFTSESHAQLFLDDFEEWNPEYWESDLWANLVRETTDNSPFSGNMQQIFKKNGNPFAGGRIQKAAHDRGCYDNIDYVDIGYRSWKSCTPERRQEISENMRNVKKKWIKDNPDAFSEHQRRRAEKGKEITAYKLLYNGMVYHSFADFERETGITKYRFMKYSLGEILQKPSRDRKKGVIQ